MVDSTQLPGSDAPPGAERYVPVGKPRHLRLDAPLRWLALGWADLRRAPLPSLLHGAILVAAGWLLAILAALEGGYVLLFALVTGFALVAPVLAFAFYDVSRQLEQDRTATCRGCFETMKRNLASELVFAILLGVILLVWLRAAAMVHVFFPAGDDHGLAELAAFLVVGSAVGALFATLVFGISAYSLPMMMDTGADIVTSVVTSLRVVSANPGTMAVWAGCIVVLTGGVGLLTGLLGLIVTLPVVGHATWHAYREAVEIPDT